MLKFMKHPLETIANVEIYPIISLLIFFVFFVVLYAWVMSYRKEKITEMSLLPFAEGTDQDHLNQ